MERNEFAIVGYARKLSGRAALIEEKPSGICSMSKSKFALKSRPETRFLIFGSNIAFE